MWEVEGILRKDKTDKIIEVVLEHIVRIPGIFSPGRIGQSSSILPNGVYKSPWQVGSLPHVGDSSGQHENLHIFQES